METELILTNSSVRYIHPCYILLNNTYVFASNPSSRCVLLYIFLGSQSLLTSLGNLLVVISIIHFKQLHSPTNYLILSLAAADLLVGLVVFPSSMAITVSSCMHHEDFFCKLRDSFDITLCTASILNLCCISIDRYHAVCRPLTYRQYMNVRVTAYMILATWCVSLLIGIAITVAGFSQGTCEGDCLSQVVAANTLGPLFSFYLPAIMMLCIYFKIFLVARRQISSLQKSGADVSKMERKATKTLAIVMGLFLLCLTPYFLCVVFQPLFTTPPQISVIETLNWLALSNSMLNPLIYAFFYCWFRAAFRIIVSGRVFQRNSANTQLS